jgi:hypothetical protein
VPIQTLQTKLVIERLLARLFQAPDPPWLLKGGYAFELRYRPNARTTRDIDLTSPGDAGATRIAGVRAELQVAAELDLGDFLQFRIGEARSELQGAPLGGARFPVEALIAGKVFGTFHLDVGFGDARVGETELLVGDDLLAFAGVEPARVRAISRCQQFAEKIHAYTIEWADRENMRVKDLVDLLVLIERGALEPAELRTAIDATFLARRRQAIPAALVPPPRSWVKEYEALAHEAGVEATGLDAAFHRLAAFWRELGLG